MIASVAPLEPTDVEFPNRDTTAGQPSEGVSEDLDRAIYKRRCNVLDAIYEAMGAIFPDDIDEIDLDFHGRTEKEPPYRYATSDGEGHFTLYLNSPQVSLMGEIDAVAMFQQWAEFCAAAAENIAAAQRVKGAALVEAAE